MQIDPRLDEIDDCLYRVAIRVLIVQNNKVLLVKEADDEWWALPGGGVGHGETVEDALKREVEEELGVPAARVSSELKVAYFSIGKVVNGVPRMNIFFKTTVPEELLRGTGNVAEWAWFSKDEFLRSELNASFDKAALAKAIF